MATRMYFSSAVAAEVSPSFGAWSETDGAERRKLLTAKDAGESPALGTRLGWTAANTQLDRQYVSPPLSGAQTISGTVKMQLACREFNNGDNSTSRLHIRVIQPDLSDRGTALAIGQYGPATEYINNATLRNKTFADGDTITSVAAQDGDRIVVEVGHTDTGATPEAQARYGAPSGTSDHGENETETTSLVPWIEFSATLTFQSGQLFDASANDSVAVADTVARDVQFDRSVSDSVAVTDTVSAGLELGGSALDAVGVTDAVSVEEFFDRSPSDSVAVTDQLTAETNYVREASDSVSVTDTVTGGLEVDRTVGPDSVAVTDAVSAAEEFDRTLSDSVAVTDQLTAFTDYVRSVADAVTVGDSVSASVNADRSAADSVAVTDQTTVEVDYALGISDSVAVTDNALTGSEFGRTQFDSVAVTDGVLAEIVGGALLDVSAADAVAVTDEVDVELISPPPEPYVTVQTGAGGTGASSQTYGAAARTSGSHDRASPTEKEAPPTFAEGFRTVLEDDGEPLHRRILRILGGGE